MNLSIHQPNYMPWLGFFFKIYLSDQFLFLDDVPFSRKSYTKRVKIRKGPWKEEAKYLSVSVNKVPRETLIQHIRIHDDFDFQAHQRRIYETYQKSEYFESFYPLLIEWFNNLPSTRLLADTNIFLIERLTEYLKIPCDFSRTSKMNCHRTGKANYIRDLINMSQATTYISGEGARIFQSEALRGLNTTIHYQNIANYYGRSGNVLFNPTYSIIEAIFKVGRVAILDIFSNYRKELGA